MQKLAILAMAGLISVTANAANWVFVSDNGGALFNLYVDVDSISKSNNVARAFTKGEYKQAIDVEEVSYDKLISLQEFHCNKTPKKSRALSMRAYLGDTLTFTHHRPTEFRYNYPDTPGATMTNFVCSYQK